MPLGKCAVSFARIEAHILLGRNMDYSDGDGLFLSLLMLSVIHCSVKSLTLNALEHHPNARLEIIPGLEMDRNGEMTVSDTSGVS